MTDDKLQQAARVYSEIWRSPIESEDLKDAFVAGAQWERERTKMLVKALKRCDAVVKAITSIKKGIEPEDVETIAGDALKEYEAGE